MNKTDTYNIGIVNYLNTLPYTWALEKLQAEGMPLNIERNTPNLIAQGFANNQYDLSLLPLGVLPTQDNTIYQSPFGIWSDGSVSSVCLLSHQSIEHINTIFLDEESRTSNILMRIIVRLFFRLDIQFLPNPEYNIKLLPNEAVISIGDKALSDKNKFPVVYDLGALWKQHTGLPFVFARWVAKSNKHLDVIQQIETQFKNTIDSLDEHVNNANHLTPTEKNYLLNFICYVFNSQASKGANQFLSWRNEL